MRVIIYGGKTWRDQEQMDRLLDALHERHHFTLVINGGQINRDETSEELYSADWQAAVWAQKKHIKILYFFANWKGEGPTAAPRLRNQRMINEGLPDIAVEFRGGRNTTDMRNRLVREGIRMLEATAVPAEMEALV